MKSPLLAMVIACLASAASAAPLAQSTFTEVVRDVNVVAPNRTAEPARVNALFRSPDLVRTGPESRAELTAADQTITRVGANTVFSFESAGRNLRLEKGSLLFHSPAGKGGGTIKSGGASAAVLGTTLIVAATENGGFKVIVLEGRGRVTLANGQSVQLRAGQMVFVLPGDQGLSPIIDINLGRLVAGSQLINGFTQPLASLGDINAAIAQQNRDIARGRARDTGMSADEFASAPKPENGLGAIDQNAYQRAVHPPMTPIQVFQLIEASGQSGGGPGGSGIVILNGPTPN